MLLEIKRTWEFTEEEIVDDFLDKTDAVALSSVWHWVKLTKEWDGDGGLQNAISENEIDYTNIFEHAFIALKECNGTDHVYTWDITGNHDEGNLSFIVSEYQIVPESEQDLWDFVKKYTKFVRR